VTPATPPRVSPWLFGQFLGYTRWYLRRHFRQVLVRRTSLAALSDDQPLVCVMNHPGWWDPLMGLLLAGQGFPRRTHYGAMDAHALETYGIFKSLGFFGVERGTTRGAVEFLRMAKAITQQPRTALWITPHGRYADVRERPVNFLAGTSHVLSRLGQGVLLPIAIEYVFWDERLPLAVAEFGEPIDLAACGPATPEQWDRTLTEAMTRVQDQLAARIIARDREPFEVWIDGQAGMGNLYGWWRWLRGHGG
jgi:1-acyl-sn-glycerol-3-phosphate acyltransferase